MHSAALTLHDALVLSVRRRAEWCLLGWVNVDGDACPVYSCETCDKRLVLVTHGRQLPDRCPKCGAARTTPPALTDSCTRNLRQAPEDQMGVLP
jgi:hypothetical protein